jgi:hypothetical protein
MIVLGFLLFVVSAVSVIYPLRFLMIQNRFVAVVGVIASFAIMGAGADSSVKSPTYSSSGGCKTDANGNMKCSQSSETNFLGSTSRSAFEMKCGKSTSKLDDYECKTESRAY